MKPVDMEALIDRHKGSPGSLIAMLEEIQTQNGFLDRESLEQVARQTRRPLVEVYGVATFYKAFSLKPKGKHQVSACLGTACHVRGAPGIAKELSRQLGIAPGETTEDEEFGFETVNCLGACALGPIVVTDGHYHSSVTTDRVADVIESTKNGNNGLLDTSDDRLIPIRVNCPKCNHSLMDPEYPIDGLPSIRTTVSSGRKHGSLRLSSLYGSQEVVSDFPIPMDKVVNIFCPHCHSELVGSMPCPECGAPMVSMIVKGGGVIQICTRRGCPGHNLSVG